MHEVGIIGIFVELQFENKSYLVTSDINFFSLPSTKIKFALEFI